MRQQLLPILVVLAACGGAAPRPIGPTIPVALRLELARAEALRAGGVDRLARSAAVGRPPGERVLALRGLGRVGGVRAATLLVAALADPTPAIRRAAAEGLVLAAPATSEPNLRLALAAERDPAAAIAMIDALGRLASKASRSALVGELGAAEVGRRRAAIAALLREPDQRTLDAAARTAVVAAGGDRDPEVRRGVARLLAHLGAADAAVETARLALVDDAEPTVRAEALRGFRFALYAIGKPRRAAAGARIAARLDDPDLAVRLAAAGAVHGDAFTEAKRQAGATTLVRAWREVGGHAPLAGVDLGLVLAALDDASATVDDGEVVAAAETIFNEATARIDRATSDERLPLAWIACRAEVVVASAGRRDELACPGLPASDRFDLQAAVAVPRVDATVAQRLAALAEMVASQDPLARAAALAHLYLIDGSMVVDEEDRAREAAEAAAAAAAAAAASDSGDEDDGEEAADDRPDPDPVPPAEDDYDAELAHANQTVIFPAFARLLVTGLADVPAVAAQAADTIFILGDLGSQDAEVGAALVARTERELAAAERSGHGNALLGSLVDALGGLKAAGAEAMCRAVYGAAIVGVGERGRACLAALGHEPGPVEAIIPPTPAVDPALALGHRFTLHLVTSRGDLAIELDADAAPWNVAAIVARARAGGYDGEVVDAVTAGLSVELATADHRAPAAWLPAERSVGPSVRGRVTVSEDLGDDSSGELDLWLAPAPAGSDATQVGQVTAGLEVLDRLLPGDRIERAEVVEQSR